MKHIPIRIQYKIPIAMPIGVNIQGMTGTVHFDYNNTIDSYLQNTYIEFFELIK